MKSQRGSVQLSFIGTMIGLSISACGTGQTDGVEDETGAVSEALQGMSNSSNAVEAANLLRGPRGFKFEAAEGFRCDSSPEMTSTEVCGQSLPATVHLEWTDCAAPRRGSGGPPFGGGQGGLGMHGGPRHPHGPPPDGGFGKPDGRPERGHGRAHGPSSGTVDIVNTYSTPDGCAGAIIQEQKVTFAIQRTDEDGAVAKTEGATTSMAQLVVGEPPRIKSSQVDVTRTLTDASGAVVRSVHLTGSNTIAFTTDSPPTRTVNGSYTETYLDGTQGTVTQTDVVQPPMNICAWPTSGTLSRIGPDGVTHTLVYGPECGQGTLDGTAIELPKRHPGRAHRGH